MTISLAINQFCLRDITINISYDTILYAFYLIYPSINIYVHKSLIEILQHTAIYVLDHTCIQCFLFCVLVFQQINPERKTGKSEHVTCFGLYSLS